jgi:hypothetical protein
MAVSANKNTNLYVLSYDDIWWLATLGTNRRECWAVALKYSTKRDLIKKGYRCVRVKLIAAPPTKEDSRG